MTSVMHTLAYGVSCCPLATHVASYGGGTSKFMVMLEDTWGALVDECGACRQECQGALPTFSLFSSLFFLSYTHDSYWSAKIKKCLIILFLY
jgi:hypothetical protein